MEQSDNQRRLTATQVRDRLGGISDMTLWRWLQDEGLGFPKPAVIKRRRYFLEADIEKWEAAHIQVAA